MGRASRGVPVAVGTGLAALVVAGCAAPPASLPVDAGVSEPSQWVVVSYDGRDEDPAMMALLGTEMAADAALQGAGAGYIDGNEVGQTYEMYFVGHNRKEMWTILRPVLAEAPLPWTRVELLTDLDDEDPIVILADRKTSGPTHI